MVQQNRPSRAQFEAAAHGATGTPDPVRIVTRDIGIAREGARFSSFIDVTGGSGDYEFEVNGLPAGLAVDDHSGWILGTPLRGTASEYDLGVVVTDRNNRANVDNTLVRLLVEELVAQPVGGATGVRTGRRIGDPVPPAPVQPAPVVVHHDDHHHGGNNWGWLIPTGLLALLLCCMLSVFTGGIGTVFAGRPQVSAKAEPQQVQAGQPVMLGYASANADRVTLNGNPVPLSGSVVVNPAATTDYLFVAYGGPFDLLQAAAPVRVAVVGGGSPPPSNTPAPNPSVVPSVVPSVQPTPGPSVGGSWTPAQKCAWLRSNFPQNLQGIQAKIQGLVEGASISADRVADHLYPCSGTDTAHDGGIILGPQEGRNYTAPFTLAVPDHGAIDIYPGGTCTGNSRPIGPETVRCLSGKVVNVVRATYWPFNDDDPPLGGGTMYPQPATSPVAVTSTAQCIQPQDLAKQQGWSDKGWADQKFGGLRVELTKLGTLPDKWEAKASGRDIKQDDTDRSMVPTFWSIYPPYACREQLGYQR